MVYHLLLPNCDEKIRRGRDRKRVDRRGVDQERVNRRGVDQGGRDRKGRDRRKVDRRGYWGRRSFFWHHPLKLVS